MSNLRRFLTGTCFCLSRKFHGSPRPCISRVRFPSPSFLSFSSLTLNSDMPPSATVSNSEPSTVRLPQPIQTQVTDPGSMDKNHTPPSAGPGAYDPSVIPPSHDPDTRTIVLCFDGTGDQFDADVCAMYLFTMSPSSTESRS